MPAVNHVVLASGAVVAVSVAVAVATALYENPDLRRYADDVRRRIALALHSLGDGVNPAGREPMFNRPEDADGFLETSNGAEPGVDADEETRRRQREELLYWNSVRLAQSEKGAAVEEKDHLEDGLSWNEKAVDRPGATKRGSSFDDFLRPDESADKGTFVYNSGTDLQREQQPHLRQRGDGARAFSSALLANPFADEQMIGHDEWDDDDDEDARTDIAPVQDTRDNASDIYSATTRDADDEQLAAVASSSLLDMDQDEGARSVSSVTLDKSMSEGHAAAVDDGDHSQDGAYSAIQAWAEESSRDFYSPLPVTPAGPVSEPDLVSDGQLTPTDSVSVVDLGNDTMSSHNGDSGRPYDVLSESEGMLTPASWSEVGSVVSENDGPIHA